MFIPIKLFTRNFSIDFISKRYYAFAFSGILTLSIIIFIFIKGINLGIDFAGGIIMEIECGDAVKVDQLRKILSNNGYTNFSIQDFYKNKKRRILLRLNPTERKNNDNKNSSVANEIDAKYVIENIKKVFNIKIMEDGQRIEFIKVEYVGPKVGKEFVTSAIFAMLAALIIMMLYTWVRFDLVYGLGVIIALFHDAIATLGLYCVTGYEFDLSSIAAILTVIGYSINDSVVIYDRIRENTAKYRGKIFAHIVNLSINETLSRSIMTLSTTLLVCLVLTLFGGDVLRGFSIAILFGIGFGAYSSIYISAPILMLFHNIKLPKFIKNLV